MYVSPRILFVSPGIDYKQVYNISSWMSSMEGDRSMWVLFEAVIYMEKLTTGLPDGCQE